MRFVIFFALTFALMASVSTAQEVRPTPLEVTNSNAKTEAEMKAYTELIEHSDGKIDMVPIKGGKFVMGSPATEPGRGKDEGPQHEVEIAPFWMAKCEITWDAYEVWMVDLDIFKRDVLGVPANERDKAAAIYQLTRPTKPYTDMSFGMGKRGYPAICMTQHSCRIFCKWLTMKTGRYYRLPTEAEWEYACRAGTTTAWSFGDDPDQLGDYAWFTDNSEEKYKKVGLKKPNPWGLHDMHGNVAEWVLDQHTTDFYGKSGGKPAVNPLAIPLTEYNRVVRGGGYDSDAAGTRSSVRKASHELWKEQDPQVPQSIWYLTDALGVGFRIVRPLTEPSEQELKDKWDKSEPPQIDKVKKAE